MGSSLRIGGGESAGEADGPVVGGSVVEPFFCPGDGGDGVFGGPSGHDFLPCISREVVTFDVAGRFVGSELDPSVEDEGVFRLVERGEWVALEGGDEVWKFVRGNGVEEAEEFVCDFGAGREGEDFVDGRLEIGDCAGLRVFSGRVCRVERAVIF